MDRMNPPPNYYGAMYPGSNAPGPSYNSNPQMNPMNPPPFNEENDLGMKVSNEKNSLNESTNEGYLEIQDGVESVKKFYDEIKKWISTQVGNKVKVYCAFTDSTLWHDKIFEGTLVSASDNNLIVKDENNKLTIIVSVYVIYIELI